jgi:hypothetical protein
MANVWRCNSVTESYMRISHIPTESNVQKFTISLFVIAQSAVKSWIIAKPLAFFKSLTIKMDIYHFLWGNVSQSFKI